MSSEIAVWKVHEFSCICIVGVVVMISSSYYIFVFVG